MNKEEVIAHLEEDSRTWKKLSNEAMVEYEKDIQLLTKLKEVV
jgi:hypothetical protein